MAETYVDQMFNYTTAVSAETQMNQGTSTSQTPYQPKANGTLGIVGIFITPQAATSLCQQAYVKLICTLWTPINTLIFPVAGFGIATAPQAIGGNQLPQTFDVALPVGTAVGITGFVNEFFSAVTPNVIVFGVFSA